MTLSQSNLTMEYLKLSLGNDNVAAEMYAELSKRVELIRTYRNKIFVHTDLDIAIAQNQTSRLGNLIHNHIDFAIQLIEAFLQHYCSVRRIITAPAPDFVDIGFVGRFAPEEERQSHTAEVDIDDLS